MIRPVKNRDIPQCVLLGIDMHKESRYAHLDFSVPKVVELIENIIVNPDWLGLVAEQDHQLIGFAAGYVTPHFFGNDLTSGDLAIYVAQKYRGGMLGVKLVKAYVAWCEDKGVKEPMLGVSAGITPERTGQLYERLGFTEKYQIYKKPSL